MELTVEELIEQLSKRPKNEIVVIAKENDVHYYSGALDVYGAKVEYEHSDGSIEEINCTAIRDC